MEIKKGLRYAQVPFFISMLYLNCKIVVWVGVLRVVIPAKRGICQVTPLTGHAQPPHTPSYPFMGSIFVETTTPPMPGAPLGALSPRNRHPEIKNPENLTSPENPDHA